MQKSQKFFHLIYLGLGLFSMALISPQQLNLLVKKFQFSSNSRLPASDADTIPAINKYEVPVGIFNDPPEAGVYQLTGGSIEALMGAAYIRYLIKLEATTPQSARLLEANRDDLKRAQNLPTTSDELENLRRVTQENVNKLEELKRVESPQFKQSNLDKALKELDEAKRMTITVPATKKSLIKSAQKLVDDANAKALADIVKHDKLLSKAIRGIKVLSGAVLIVDAVGRGYVWYALDASPKFSPGLEVGKYLLAGKASEEKNGGVVQDSRVPQAPTTEELLGVFESGQVSEDTVIKVVVPNENLVEENVEEGESGGPLEEVNHQ